MDVNLNKGQWLHELKLQLELADMVVRLTGSHMWSMFAEPTMRKAMEMQDHIKREIKKTQERPDN